MPSGRSLKKTDAAPKKTRQRLSLEEDGAGRKCIFTPAETRQIRVGGHKDSLCKAALTMNIAMTELQDRLAAQNDPPTPAQRELIEHHASRSDALLRGFGLSDPGCLEAVRDHHSTGPGPMATRTQGQRMARLLQRADKFAAHLSPRASRRPDTAATAMQAARTTTARWCGRQPESVLFQPE